MSNRTCSLPGCERKYVAKGYCQLHWSRNRKHGDPLAGGRGSAHKVVETADGLRICKACGVGKPLAEFHKDAGGTGGHRARCKPCRNGYMQEYYLTVADDRVAYERTRRAERGDHMRALDMARYERNKEKRIELASDGVRLRRARMAEVLTDKNVTVAALRKRDGDLCCYCGVEMSFVRCPRGEGIAPNRASLEHVMPISRGGTHTFDNTALACHRCNTSKNAKTVEEWKGARCHGGEEAVASGAA